jgi:hypothetical protein
MNKAIIAKTNFRDIFIVRSEKGFHFTDNSYINNEISSPVESLSKIMKVIKTMYGKETGFTLV